MVTASPNDPSTIAALEKVSDALSTTSPRLLDNLENALVPLRTLAQKKDDVRGLLSAGLHTTGTTATAIDNHIDQMIGIGTHLTPLSASSRRTRTSLYRSQRVFGHCPMPPLPMAGTRADR